MNEKMQAHLGIVAIVAIALIAVTAIIDNKGFNSPLLILNGTASVIGWTLFIWCAVVFIKRNMSRK